AAFGDSDLVELNIELTPLESAELGAALRPELGLVTDGSVWFIGTPAWCAVHNAETEAMQCAL
ncbi:hypothetical protein, partial [Staphylococcus aureus]|uniref:hypothetical protein n=1 Tax=Staphylococcus aureus TaxID=1280 RepID=UPI0039BE0A30